MEFYVIYDLKDNIIGYFSNIEELAYFTELRQKEIKYKLTKRPFIYYKYKGKFRKIYRFCEN